MKYKLLEEQLVLWDSARSTEHGMQGECVVRSRGHRTLYHIIELFSLWWVPKPETHSPVFRGWLVCCEGMSILCFSFWCFESSGSSYNQVLPCNDSTHIYISAQVCVRANKNYSDYHRLKREGRPYTKIMNSCQGRSHNIMGSYMNSSSTFTSGDLGSANIIISHYCLY